jgi:hypothetical protein
MSQDACEFLKSVKHGQHRWWFLLLFWWIGISLYVLLVSHYFQNIPNTAITLPFYASALLLYIPAIMLYRLKCPYCNKSAGASPFFRYKFMYCRNCDRRIKCNQTS